MGCLLQAKPVVNLMNQEIMKDQGSRMSYLLQATQVVNLMYQEIMKDQGHQDELSLTGKPSWCQWCCNLRRPCIFSPPPPLIQSSGNTFLNDLWNWPNLIKQSIFLLFTPLSLAEAPLLLVARETLTQTPSVCQGLYQVPFSKLILPL